MEAPSYKRTWLRAPCFSSVDAEVSLLAHDIFPPRYVALHSLSRNLRVSTNGRAQRLVPRGNPRRGDVDVRLRRRHSAADDALRDHVRAVRHFLHTHARRPHARPPRVAA